jgi:hypothetical protein
MASKSKRARMAPVRDLSKSFLYWAIAVFVIKIGIIFRIEGINAGSGDSVFFVDGAWLGADGENYLTGYNALLRDGIFSTEGILNYWPAGYPLFIFILSFLGESWVLTTLSIAQSAFFSYAVYFFAQQLIQTRLKTFANLVFFLVLLNPTLSLSSIVIGYESMVASGILLSLGLILRSLIAKKEVSFIKYLVFNSIILSLLSMFQPRFLLMAVLLNITWIIISKGMKASTALVVFSVVLTLIFPASLAYRNHQAIGQYIISTNLGVTMNIGAGNGATGGFKIRGEYGVPCELTGSVVQQDNQRVKCVLEWYLQNPKKGLQLFLNKTIFFWSPWFGPLENGTMGRNPWLTVHPIKQSISDKETLAFVYGNFGRVISWLWLICSLGLMVYGFRVLWVARSIEKQIALLSAFVIIPNWLISLLTIGDHRFRIPIMGISIFLQSVGLKHILNKGKRTLLANSDLR